MPYKAFRREWKLCFQILLKISKILDQPCVNLSASRLSHQLQAYIFWRHISSARQWIHFNEAGHTSFLGRPNHLPYNRQGLKENTRGQVIMILVALTSTAQTIWSHLLKKSLMETSFFVECWKSQLWYP